MTILQYRKGASGASFAFFGITTHDTIVDGPYDRNDVVEQYFGVLGEQEVPDEPHGRYLTLLIDLCGFTDESDLRTAMNTLQFWQNKLRGNLVINGDMVYQNCVFKGYLPGMPPQRFYGTNPGWGAMRLTLLWRQLKG